MADQLPAWSGSAASLALSLHALLFVLGAALLVAGRRLIKILLAIYGMFLGAALGLQLVAQLYPGREDELLYVGMIAGGLLGLVLAWMFFRVGIFILGFAVGVILAGHLMHQFNDTLALVLLIAAGAVAGLVALSLTSMMLVLFTAVLGGFLAVYTVSFFIWGTPNLVALFESPQFVHDAVALMSTSPLRFFIVLGLAALGAAIQFRGMYRHGATRVD